MTLSRRPSCQVLEDVIVYAVRSVSFSLSSLSNFRTEERRAFFRNIADVGGADRTAAKLCRFLGAPDSLRIHI